MLLLYTYYPPAQYQPTIKNQAGRIRTILGIIPFNQIFKFASRREDTILPYSGWAVSEPDTIQPNTQLRYLACG